MWKRIGPYVGPVIGLTGLMLALYFHFEAQQVRDPTYYVSPNRARIVDVSGPTASELQVLHRGKPVGAKNVVAVTVSFWNNGRMPLRPSDVLEPLAIELESPSEILEPRVLKVSREIIGFRAGPVKDDARNSLPITFNILEKSDGATIQIIYSGNPDANISLKGTVVGAGSPRILTLPKWLQWMNRPSNPNVPSKINKIVGIAFFCFGFVFATAKTLFWFRERGTGDRFPWVMVGGALAYMAMGALMWYVGYRTYTPGVPSSIWLGS